MAIVITSKYLQLCAFMSASDKTFYSLKAMLCIILYGISNLSTEKLLSSDNLITRYLYNTLCLKSQ